MGRIHSLLLAGLMALGVCACASSGESVGTVIVKPGEDAASVIAAAPSEAQIDFLPGVHRVGGIVPKDGQRLTGQPGAVISGAVPLKDWKRDGRSWRHADLPPPLPERGVCETEKPLCAYGEDLFADGTLMQRVARREDLARGRWYYDAAAGTVVITEDPKGREFELSTLKSALSGDAEDIRVENLRFEKFAGLAAIDGRDGKGWILTNVTAAWNHGAGLLAGDEMSVRGGAFVNNGRLGIGGSGRSVTIEGVEVAHNNYAGFSYDRTAGGVRLTDARELTVRRSCIHHNDGTGLWADTRVREALYEDNLVFANTREGIRYEASQDGTIRGNKVAGNGTGFYDWLWGAQILIQNSADVEVYENVIETPSGGGNGLSVVFQESKEDGAKWKAKDNHIHDNVIILRGEQSRTGLAADHDRKWFWRSSDNLFEKNQYSVSSTNRKFWGLNNRFRTWDYVQRNGQEADSTITTEMPEPLALSCSQILE